MRIRVYHTSVCHIRVYHNPCISYSCISESVYIIFVYIRIRVYHIVYHIRGRVRSGTWPGGQPPGAGCAAIVSGGRGGRSGNRPRARCPRAVKAGRGGPGLGGTGPQGRARLGPSRRGASGARSRRAVSGTRPVVLEACRLPGPVLPSRPVAAVGAGDLGRGSSLLWWCTGQ